jgi:hypothetical protein
MVLTPRDAPVMTTTFRSGVMVRSLSLINRTSAAQPNAKTDADDQAGACKQKKNGVNASHSSSSS